MNHLHWQAVACRLALGAGLLSLAGCGLFGDDGVFRDKTLDYRDAVELDPITVPEGKSRDALQEIYPIPEIDNAVLVEQDFDVPRPQPLSAGAAEQVVRIQSLGDESWALIAVAPGQLWPQVRGFLSAAGVQVARVDASAGIMETGWVALQDAQMESRFRFRIDRGVQRGTSELHVLQQNRAGDVMAWPPASDDLGQEGEMLRSVAQYIANSTESAPVSMIADRAISASGRISLQEADEGYTYIELGLPFNRAWASLAIALEDAYFEITDQDRSAGRYYVTFIGEQEEDSGWFDWFGSDEHPLSGRRMLVTVTPESEEVMRIRLLSDQGEPELALRDEQGLLSMIKGNIN